MKFFIDTADIDEIRKLDDLDMVDGVTTNPSLILKSGRDILETIKDISELVEGPVSAEVVSIEFEQMLKEGQRFATIAPNVCVKVPLTWEGLRVCKILTDQGTQVNVTLCFSANQALLAAKAGATFISPFIGRLDDLNVDGMQVIQDIRTIYDNYDIKTEILAASIRSPNHMKEAALIGADVATAPPKVIHDMIKHPLTQSGLDQFGRDAKEAGIRIV